LARQQAGDELSEKRKHAPPTAKQPRAAP
jgi:hypothetical protein